MHRIPPAAFDGNSYYSQFELSLNLSTMRQNIFRLLQSTNIPVFCFTKTSNFWSNYGACLFGSIFLRGWETNAKDGRIFKKQKRQHLPFTLPPLKILFFTLDQVQLQTIFRIQSIFCSRVGALFVKRAIFLFDSRR